MAEITIGAGLLMYRKKNGKLEVMLVHPGGPFFKNKDAKSWDIPKGSLEGEEDLFSLAKREFKEETGFEVADSARFIELGTVTRPGKTVHIWAFEGDCDPTKLVSNTCMVEWPPRSGKQIEIPEVDRGAFFDLATARTKLYAYLTPIIDKFEKIIT